MMLICTIEFSKIFYFESTTTVVNIYVTSEVVKLITKVAKLTTKDKNDNNGTRTLAL